MTWRIEKSDNDWRVVYDEKTNKNVVEIGAPSMFVITKEMFYAKQKYVNLS